MKGLSNEEANNLLKKFGKNELKRTKEINPFKIFISQFTSPLIIILILAALSSWAIGFLPNQESNIVDTILILTIVLISGISGFIQDYKAEKTIEALQKIATPKTRIIRDEIEIEIEITQIVPGDLIILEEGNIIPADCKLIEMFSLEVDESTLTGESSSIKKKLEEELFKGTSITSGNAMALVTKTGMQTRIGQIAEKLEEIKDEKSSFEKEMSSFSKKILYSVLGIIFIIFIISALKYSIYQSLLTSISLAVAAIPEGLPAILVLVLAIGAKVMATKNALVRKLNVVESIGSIDVICTDKTGTLTKNEMSVTKIFTNNKTLDTSKLNPEEIKEIHQILLTGKLCNNSKISKNETNEKIYFGDQTEIAIRKISEKYLDFKENYEKISEISFDSGRKMMSSIYEKDNKFYTFSKGAPEILLKKCDRIYINGKIIKLTNEAKQKILQKNKDFASQALRVLGFAFNETTTKDESETNLIWLGLQAMIDPPRKEAKQAIQECYTAGIKVIMMTGDNPLTAEAISNEIGLKSKGVISGEELDRLSDKEIENKLKDITIFARVSPFHKLKILEILKKNYRVAMTGDGVNDALALKKADVGISMGVRGTDVAKQASDIILLDDNFATIPAAIKEGRRSFENIRKFTNYLFVSNLAEIGVLFFATLFLTLKNPILLPIQILWINLLTDGLPAIALGLDPATPNIMEKPPRKKDEPIINKSLAWLIGIIGTKKIIMLLLTFILINHLFGIEQARTALFTGFILYEFVRIGTIRTQEKLTWLSNKWLLVALAFSLLLQLTIIYTPLNTFFHIMPLNLYSWIILLIGIVIAYALAIIITKIVLKLVKD
ncbi:cation-translocating P-type ATPase [Candidatus Pacearchaeota archaeon]|nr:cation-translocating P-type ATPase [Candidatus Pacearchaeota archaeon]